MEWQVQIWVSEAEEWYGWAHTDYDPTDERDANRAAKIAAKYGWETRVVPVCEEDCVPAGCEDDE